MLTLLGTSSRSIPFRSVLIFVLNTEHLLKGKKKRSGGLTLSLSFFRLYMRSPSTCIQKNSWKEAEIRRKTGFFYPHLSPVGRAAESCFTRPAPAPAPHSPSCSIYHPLRPPFLLDLNTASVSSAGRGRLHAHSPPTASESIETEPANK